MFTYIFALIILSVLSFVVASLLKSKHFYISLAFYVLSTLLPLISIYLAPTNLSLDLFVAKTFAVILSICFTILGVTMGLDLNITELRTCSATNFFGAYIILILCVLLSLLLLETNSCYLDSKSIETSYELHSVKLTSRVEGEIDGNFMHTEGTIAEPDKISIYYFDNDQFKVYTTYFDRIKINIVKNPDDECFKVKKTVNYEEKFIYDTKVTTIESTTYSFNLYVTKENLVS